MRKTIRSFELRKSYMICPLPFALCVLIFWKGVGGGAIAQSYPDAGLWTTFSLEYKINSALSATFDEEFRMKENFSRLNLFYTNLGIEYKITKKIKTAFIYRWTDKFQDDNTFSYRHRLIVDIAVKNKFGRVILSYRHRLQAENRNVYTSIAGKVPEWFSRNKFSVKYDLNKPFTPSAEVELRYQVHDPRAIESDKTWHRIRYSLGMDYKPNDKNTFGAYYLIQREWNVLSPQFLYVIGLEYSLSI